MPVTVSIDWAVVACRTQRLNYGTEIDIWSVGCICGELLLSAPVFQYETEIDMVNGIVRGLGVPDPEKWPGVIQLPGWESLVKKQEYSDLERSLFNRVCHRRPVSCLLGFSLTRTAHVNTGLDTDSCACYMLRLRSRRCPEKKRRTSRKSCASS